MANFESVLLLLSLAADKSPELNSAILENHFPLPTLVLQRARRRLLLTVAIAAAAKYWLLVGARLCKPEGT